MAAPKTSDNVTNSAAYECLLRNKPAPKQPVCRLVDKPAGCDQCVHVADAPKTGTQRALWSLVAFVMACVFAIGTIWVARQAVGADTEQLAARAAEMVLAQRPSAGGASDEQMRAQMMPMMRIMLSLYPVTVPVGVLFSTLVISTLLFGVYRVLGVQLRWPMAFAACCTGAAGSALLRFLITLVVVFIIRKSIPAESFLDNSIVPLNVAAFLPPDTSAVWRSAAAKLDLLQLIYALGLVMYLVDEEGLAKDARKIVVGTMVCYALWIVGGMLWAAAWSGFSP